MKFLRSLGLLAVMVCLAVALPATASATELVNGSGMVTLGSTVSAEAEGAISFTGPTGVECSGSSFSAKTTTTGGSSETVKANVETLDFTGCSQTVTVLAKGTLELHTQEGSANGNGTLTSTGAEVTIKFSGLGIDCIYKTSNTDIGTVTGSTNTGSTATYDISATVPRTGGSIFCGTTGKWTGSYKVTTPDTLNVDTTPPPAETTLTTSLSGEENSGEEITVNEGAKVKDTATLSGENAGKAAGTVKYKVYADKECKELVTSAGEVTVSEGKVPASEEKTLEAGRVYYWQAEYSGDSKNAASKSTCGKEVLTIKAATTLATSLSGEEKSGEEITVNEGAKVKDTATLSGTKSSTATGKAKYKVYSDSKCEKLVTEAGEVTVSEGKVPASEEKTLEAGTVYYWQAEYAGDTLHQASKSTCGKEVLTVKALVSIATVLAGQGAEGDETVEGEEISVPAGTAVVDTATLSGTKASTATGTLKYKVYSDSKCEKLVTESEVTVAGTAVPSSAEVTVEEGTYYWQAVYSGDSLHKESTSACGVEIARAITSTTLTTTLSGEGKEAVEIEVTKGTAVTDSAKLSGKNASKATGNVEYFVYSDVECEELVTKAGKVTVSGETVPASTPQTLEPGVYFWKAAYSGDSSNYASKSACGDEILLVTPRITTELSGGGDSGEEIEVTEGTPVSDSATLYGEKAAEATGTVNYLVYPDEYCEEEPVGESEVEVEGASVPASEEMELEPGTYYWVAEYSGDLNNPEATSECGAEMVVVVTPTTLTTTLSGGGEEGTEIEVEEGTAVTDSAELSGENAATAEGSISYAVYADSECTELETLAGGGEFSEGEVPGSEEVVLPAGTYYWMAEYSGDGVSEAATGVCGAEIEVVTGITTMLSSGEQSGTVLEVNEKAGVTDSATIIGPYASEAEGTVEYFVYGDNQCEELVTEAGEATVEGASVPPSNEVKLEAPGVYYWQAVYSGDGTNPPATSACGVEQQVVANMLKAVYASLGDSFSSGEGIKADKGKYYKRTDERPQPKVHSENRCHRSEEAWPALVASKKFGAGVIAENTVLDQAPASFIFRACSGSETQNLWSGGGKAAEEGLADEFITAPAAKWITPKPAQNLWLTTPGGIPKGKANANISTVTVTIGGNDAGFAAVAKACLQYRGQIKYTPAKCQAEIAIQSALLPAHQKKIVTVLEDIAAKAPKARIAFPLYPSLLFPNGTKIPVLTKLGKAVVFINDVKKLKGMTAATSIEKFVNELNTMVTAAVKDAVAKKVDVRLIPTTATAFFGHRIGSPGASWVNPIILSNKKESFHPNRCGHKALAHHIYKALDPGAPPATC